MLFNNAVMPINIYNNNCILDPSYCVNKSLLFLIMHSLFFSMLFVKHILSTVFLLTTPSFLLKIHLCSLRNWLSVMLPWTSILLLSMSLHFITNWLHCTLLAASKILFLSLVDCTQLIIHILPDSPSVVFLLIVLINVLVLAVLWIGLPIFLINTHIYLTCLFLGLNLNYII